jgi:hypothetical protein
MMLVTKGTSHIHHVYQYNIVPCHVQWQLTWWLDVSGEGKNHVKKRKKKNGKNRKYGKKKKNTK